MMKRNDRRRWLLIPNRNLDERLDQSLFRKENDGSYFLQRGQSFLVLDGQRRRMQNVEIERTERDLLVEIDRLDGRFIRRDILDEIERVDVQFLDVLVELVDVVQEIIR